MKKSFLLLFLLYCTSIFAAAAVAQTNAALKVLAIGNSFSEDALENYLLELAQQDGKEIIIGNMYIGGAPLSLHVENATANLKAYSYRKINSDAKKITTENRSIEEVLGDENWDYISLQQASPLSGRYEEVERDLPELIAYVQQRAPKAKLIYHQTWAYQQDSKHPGFANYNNNQESMYQGILAVSQRVKKYKAIQYIVPAGIAIQYARKKLGDNFTRDGYHLQLDYGRFTAACTWYEMLFKTDVRKNSYKPQAVTTRQAKIAKDAAHYARKYKL
ncbi:DUF4886 domain-containing protein [Sphingobacterium sp. Mn56C]|uniref:DUF4886 domain-containing protein n=1 Tax=Sphingobacterium sp. Mn56C TaxID=3395261 RepID=UPI003BD49A1B